MTVQVQPLLGTKKAELVRKCLDTYYKRNFYRNMETTWLRPGKNRISFIEENCFHVVFGQRCCNKKGEDVCGDTFHLLILEEKEQSCFCQMEWVLEKKRMRIAGD